MEINERRRLSYAKQRLPEARAEIEALQEQPDIEVAPGEANREAREKRYYKQERILVLREEIVQLRGIISEAREGAT